VYVSPARQQTIGVRKAVVGHQTLGTTLRTVGLLAYDETRVTQIHTKVSGWVERVFADYLGKIVARGDPLFTVYSPQLVATQMEYLLALQAKESPSGADASPGVLTGESLVAVARDRLKLWDISDSQIEKLRRTHQIQKTLTLHSQFSGIVLERNVFAGQYVTPEMAAYKIADLSSIWVVGEVFEYEISRIRVGQEAEIEFPYGQTRKTLEGRIGFVYPTIDPQTRRVKVRGEFRNPGLEFKPGTYVTLVLRTTDDQRLAVPKEAVIDTGTKRYVILALPNGYFEPREIEIGEPGDEFYPVVGGLAEGDVIVTSAQFLIDSETNLQAAMKAMSATMPGMSGGGEMNMPGMEKTMPEQSGAAPEAPQGHESHGR
jgi:multidrug efflux pump subunit AcrA (membrane-fusion protein)